MMKGNNGFKSVKNNFLPTSEFPQKNTHSSLKEILNRQRILVKQSHLLDLHSLRHRQILNHFLVRETYLYSFYPFSQCGTLCQPAVLVWNSHGLLVPIVRFVNSSRRSYYWLKCHKKREMRMSVASRRKNLNRMSLCVDRWTYLNMNALVYLVYNIVNVYVILLMLNIAIVKFR